MKVFGRHLSEYARFCSVFLILISGVAILRLALSLGGMPNSTIQWLSVTILVWIGSLYYAVRVHTSGFGSYKELLVICVLQNLVAQAVIIFGIVLAILTGTNNIYTVPENAFGGDGRTWLHAGAHLVIGTTLGPLGPWLIGSLILFVTRKMSRSEANINSAA